MKTIYINGRFLTQPITGVQRYGYELLRELDSLLAEGECKIKVEILIPHAVNEVPSYRYLTARRVGVLSGHLWEQIELPLYSFRGVLFTPGGGAPVVHPRNVVTIHDAAVIAAPAGYGLLYRTWYKLLYRVLCRVAIRIITVSNFSKDELIRLCGVRPERVTVIYLGSDHLQGITADESILKQHELKRYGYILAVSSRNPNKNFSGIISAINYLPKSNLEVAIAGKAISHIYGKTSLDASVVKDLGYVTDSELKALYQNARCFVFPSFYEGFGLPPIEAISLGCPAVVGNVASMPEIFSGIATFCDPYNPEDIANAIHEALSIGEDTINRESSATRATQYTWQKCAQETWNSIFAAACDELGESSS